MTPKEKAQELVDKFSNIYGIGYGNDGGFAVWSTKIAKQIAKQCALIAVDELLEVIRSDESAIIVELQYWEQVKTEINNL